MAGGAGALKHVEVVSSPLERFAHLLDRDTWTELEKQTTSVSAALGERPVWNVNSTARGGGVAELLGAVLHYERGAGIDARWVVIEGSPEFFATTKKIHTLLHGVEPADGMLTDEDRRHYESAIARNADALSGLIRSGDVAILHDPQTLGLVPPLAARGVHVIWRSHIGVDVPNDVARKAWAFLRPYLAPASAYIFSRRAYTWEGLDPSRVRVIAPCIDPFATKNTDAIENSAGAILQAGGIVSGRDGEPVFPRADGAQGRVVGKSTVVGERLPIDARMVVQISRWDRLKDPIGVMEAFARHVAPRTDACLVLAGPAATSVSDDPEQPEVLRELTERREAMPREMRDRTVVAQLPMEDPEENAALVNALQRRAEVVVQKSLAEGFGLTVAEAMWKKRPVVAGRVGGIQDQIENERSGFLIDDPKDLDAFGHAVVRVLEDGSLEERLGQEARDRVTRNFIAPRHMIEMARLIQELLAQ
jgi:trehalose synthase